MISSQQEEEKKKDEVLQQINDALEKENWGGSCGRFVLKVVFNGKYQVESVCGNKKFDK
ncbi:MAG: hypothetical protein WC823_00190 [Parcubacteria group bacterium]|jgi:hypothetical protein